MDTLFLFGHRRLKVCQKLGIEEVPVKVKDFDEEWQELEFLLISNTQRLKTVGDRVREGWCYEMIEGAKAKERQGTRTDLEDNISPNLGESSELRRTDEIVGAKIGMSKNTYRAASKVLKDLYTWYDENDELTTKTEGNDFESEALASKKVDFYDALLAVSVAGAKRAYEGGLYDDLIKHGKQDLIDKAINGDITLKKLEEEGSEVYRKAVATSEVRREYDERTGSDYEEKQGIVQNSKKQ